VKLADFEPVNELESSIVETKAGRLAPDALLAKMAQSIVFISSKTEVQQDGSGFSPLLLGESSNPLVAVFSSLARSDLHRHMAEYVLQMNGNEFIKRLPAGYGFVLNPGFIVQLVVTPPAAADLKSKLPA
jgi:hypothetical protein